MIAANLPNSDGNFYYLQDIMAILAILMTAPYFLFFCRGLKMVGPFVIMIYKMLVGDLLRFFTIYIIFLIGFSQVCPPHTPRFSYLVLTR